LGKSEKVKAGREEVEEKKGRRRNKRSFPRSNLEDLSKGKR
jgi:hypothetical protein